MPVVPPSVSLPVVPDSATDLLDLVVGQRQATFRFRLLDLDLLPIGDLSVATDAVPLVDNQTDRTVKRTLDGLEVPPPESLDVDPLNDRVEAEMILSDGSIWPLGVFLFTANNMPVYGWGAPLLPSLADQTTILAQPISVPISVRPGSLVTDVLIERLSNYRLPRGVIIEDSPARTGTKAPMVWPPGTDEYEILVAISAIAGFHVPYFDNSGILTIRSPKSTAFGTEPDHVYDLGDRILADSLVFSNDLLDTPNRYLVIDSSATDNAIYASYDLPAADPASASNRGFVLSKVLTPQSVGSVENAVALATKAAKSARTTETLAFSSPPDPRHDTFETATVLGLTYREVSWSMPLKEGEPMTHSLTRSYE